MIMTSSLRSTVLAGRMYVGVGESESILYSSYSPAYLLIHHCGIEQSGFHSLHDFSSNHFFLARPSLALTSSSAAKAATSCSCIHSRTSFITLSNAPPPSNTFGRLPVSLPHL